MHGVKTVHLASVSPPAKLPIRKNSKARFDLDNYFFLGEEPWNSSPLSASDLWSFLPENNFSLPSSCTEAGPASIHSLGPYFQGASSKKPVLNECLQAIVLEGSWVSIPTETEFQGSPSFHLESQLLQDINAPGHMLLILETGRASSWPIGGDRVPVGNSGEW